MKQLIKERAAELSSRLIEIRRFIHANPELSFEEHNTAKYVFDFLTDLGLSPSYMANTGVVAVIEGAKPGKTIALRADLDALPIQEDSAQPYCSTKPGVMHACGHDVHTTSLLGAAHILTGLKSEITGSVKLIFQPGEEQLPGGASLMIKEGVLENPQPAAILGQHVFTDLEVGKVGFRSGQYMASCDEIHISVHGRGGHAAMPHKNIDPVLISAHIITGIQQIVSRRANPLTPSVVSFGKVEANGATNVIPDTVSLAGTFRTFDETWRNQAHHEIKTLCEELAVAMGGSCDVDIRKGYPYVHNNPLLTEQARSAAVEFLGEENVVNLDMRMTGEDFSFYTQEMPGSFYRLGVRNEAKGITHPVHTTKFDVDESCLEIGAGLMAWIAINYLEE